MVEMLKRLVVEEEGNDATEYALLAALIAAVIIGTVTALGNSVNAVFSTVANAIAVPAA